VNLNRVALAQCPAQPWRNGGGLTRELLAWPSRQDWIVRVSVADIAASGPFSAFPGIDRWFAVLEGEGVVLSLPDGEHGVGRGEAPLRFPGEDRPGCRLVGGATRDLNLMVRRDGAAATMVRADAGSTIDGRTRWRAIYAASAARLECDGTATPLHAGTLAWTDAQDAAAWRLLDAATAYWMTLA
jgi:hypothetical protein